MGTGTGFAIYGLVCIGLGIGVMIEVNAVEGVQYFGSLGGGWLIGTGIGMIIGATR